MAFEKIDEYIELVYLLSKYIVLSYALWVSLVIILAATGKTCGVRFVFIKLMLEVFEWGKQRIHIHEDMKRNGSSKSKDGSSEMLYDSLIFNNSVIEKEENIITANNLECKTIEELKHEFELSDIMVFCKEGIESICQDEVTQRFDTEELSSWNLLTRTNQSHEFISYRLTILYYIGWVLRYIILLPFRFSLAIVAISLMIFGTGILGYLIPEGRIRKKGYNQLSKTCYRIMARAFSAVIKFHNIQNRARGGGICVANHTSPIDIIILGCDNTYAMVGQEHGGFFGFMLRAFSRASTHIWFKRSELEDRSAVGRRLKEHVADTNKMPILIFPEGTCINNTSIMMFKKGSFETDGTIYPVAIKYDARFADPFWNSSKSNLVHHLLLIMTSWSLVVDIWYLPPQKRKQYETAIDFADRVKSEIARQGGLVDMQWDGALKRAAPKPQMKEKAQEIFSKFIKSD